MKFFKKICLMFATLMCSLMVIGVVDTLAASATISFGTDKSTIKADQTFQLVVIVDSSDGEVGDVKAKITYDESMFELIDSDSHIKGNVGLLKLEDVDATSQTTKNYEVTFKALKRGNTTIAVSGNPEVSDKDSNYMSVSAKDLAINVGVAADSNADTTLATLDINVGNLEPEFNPSVNSYKATVPFTTDKLFVDAKASDSKNSTIAIVGNDDLKVGANSVIVTVTAQDGSSTEYSITVIKETQNGDIKPGTIEAVIQDSGFNVYEDGEGNSFIQNGNAYQVLAIDEDTQIPNGFEKTKLNIFNKVTITAYTIRNDLDNDYMLIYCKNVDTGDIGFYQYDRVEHTLQRYTISNNISNIASNTKENGNLSNNQKMTIALIGAVLCALVIILLILLIKAVIKIKGLKSDDIY